jgi:hypothetical protein
MHCLFFGFSLIVFKLVLLFQELYYLFSLQKSFTSCWLVYCQALLDLVKLNYFRSWHKVTIDFRDSDSYTLSNRVFICKVKVKCTLNVLSINKQIKKLSVLIKKYYDSKYCRKRDHIFFLIQWLWGKFLSIYLIFNYMHYFSVW